MACELVIRWKPVPSYNFSKSSSIGKNVVYITKSSDSEEDGREVAAKTGITDKKKKSHLKPPRFIFPGDTRTCPLCDQVGHVLRYCGNNELGLSKPTVEDQQKQTDYQAKRKAAARKPKPKPVDTEIFMTSFYSDSDEESVPSTQPLTHSSPLPATINALIAVAVNQLTVSGVSVGVTISTLSLDAMLIYYYLYAAFSPLPSTTQHDIHLQ